METLVIRDSFRGRLLGYLMQKQPDRGTGLLLLGVRHIHTFLMRFPIDVVYLDASFVVLGRRTGVFPNRIIFDPPHNTWHVLEVPHCPQVPPAVCKGDRLSIWVKAG